MNTLFYVSIIIEINLQGEYFIYQRSISTIIYSHLLLLSQISKSIFFHAFLTQLFDNIGANQKAKLIQ